MLTYDDVMTLTGRELDVAVAVGVFGWEWRRHGTGETSRLLLHGPNGECGAVFWSDDDAPEWRDGLPRYSSDIAAAWQVFERNGYLGLVSYMGEEYVCELHAGFDEDGQGVNVQATGLTAPEAICRAALLAAIKEAE